MLAYTFSAWSDWEPWSHCSSSCGGGFKQRFRTCKQGSNCTEDKQEEETGCNKQPCSGKLVKS